MPINVSFLDELEDVQTQAPSTSIIDDFVPAPAPVRKSPGINHSFLDALESDEHPDIIESKAQITKPFAPVLPEAKPIGVDTFVDPELESISHLEQPEKATKGFDPLRPPKKFSNQVILDLAEKSRPSSNVIESVSFANQLEEGLTGTAFDFNAPKSGFWEQVRDIPKLWWAITKTALAPSKQAERGEAIDKLKELRKQIKFDVPAPERDEEGNLTLQGKFETGSDITTGIGAFMTQILVTKALIPAGTVLSDAVAWEMINRSQGGIPGKGAAVQGSLSAISQIPTTTLGGKAAKVVSSGTLFGGVTYAEGGDFVDVTTSFAIGAGFAGWQIHKQNVWLKDFEQHLKLAEKAKIQSNVAEANKTATQTYQQNISKGMNPAQAKALLQKSIGNNAKAGTKQLNDAQGQIKKAMDVVARKLQHGKLKGQEADLAKEIVEKGLTPEAAAEVAKVKLPAKGKEARFEKARQKALKFISSGDPKKVKIGKAQLDFLEKRGTRTLKKDVAVGKKAPIGKSAEKVDHYLEGTNPETGKKTVIPAFSDFSFPEGFEVKKIPFDPQISPTAIAQPKPAETKDVEPTTEVVEKKKAPEPTEAVTGEVVRPSEMTRDEFIESHKNQFVKQEGKRRVFGVISTDGVNQFGVTEQKNGKLTKPVDEILGRIYDEQIAPQKGKPNFFEQLKKDQEEISQPPQGKAEVKEVPKTTPKAEVKGKQKFTNIPDELRSINTLVDKGKRGIRTEEDKAFVLGATKRKTKSLNEALRDFDELPTNLPRSTIKAFQDKTDEVFKLRRRKNQGGSVWLVPKSLNKQLREELGEEAFTEAPTRGRSDKQRLNDMIQSMKTQQVDDAGIGQNILGLIPGLDIAEKDLNDKQKAFVKEFRDAEQKSGKDAADIQREVDKEVPPDQFQEADEEAKIGDNFDDFLDFMEDQEDTGDPKQDKTTLIGGKGQRELLDKEDFKTVKEQERVNAKDDIEGQQTFLEKKPDKAPTELTPVEKEAQRLLGKDHGITFDELKSRVEKYIPKEKVSKLGKNWLYETVLGNDHPSLFDTKREATEAATRHHDLYKKGKLDDPEGFLSLSSQARLKEFKDKQKEKKSISKGVEPIVQRRINAENRFIEFAKETAGLTQKQAEKARDELVKAKGIKFDANEFQFTHGEFANPDVLRRAAGILETPAEVIAEPTSEETNKVLQDNELRSAEVDSLKELEDNIILRDVGFTSDPTTDAPAKGEPGFAGISDRPGGKSKKPWLTLNKTTSPDEEIEDFFGRTEKLPAKISMRQMIERAKFILRGAFLTQTPFLPSTPRTAFVRDIIRTMPEKMRSERERAIRDILAILEGDGSIQVLDHAGLDLLRRKVFVQDLVFEANIDRSVSCDLSLEQLEAEDARLDELINQVPSVKKAYEARQKLWKQVSQDLYGRGVLNEEARDNVSYVRHFVLDYIQNQRRPVSSPKKKLAEPYRSYKKQRKGSRKDISTHYLSVEIRALSDIYADNVIEDEANDIAAKEDRKAEFKAKANRQNFSLLVGGQENVDRILLLRDEIAESRRTEGNDSAARLHRKNMIEELQDLDPTYFIRQKMAIAFSHLGEDFEEDGFSDFDGNLFKELSRIANEAPDSQEGIAAKTIFKAISDRKKLIKQSLGDQFVTAQKVAEQTFTPSGSPYTEWHYKRPNLFYRAATLDQAKLAAMIEENALEMGDTLEIPRSMMHTALVLGRREGWYIPEELAMQLDDLPVNYRGHPIIEGMQAVSKGLIQWWKRWILRINPFRYNARNQLGDTERLIASGQESALKRIPQAVKILIKKEGEFYEGAKEYGVVGSSLWHEMGDVSKLKEFEQFKDFTVKKDFKSYTFGILSAPLKIASRVGTFEQDLTQLREDILRLAVYIDNLEKMRAGKDVKHWAGKIADIDAIAEESKERAAAKISRETLIDYGSFTIFEDNVFRNGLIPFYSFKKRNLTFWPRALVNATREGGGKAGRKTAGIAVSRGTFNLAKWLLRVAWAYGLAALWNHRDEEEEVKEESIPFWQRSTPHINIGNKTIWGDTALADFSEWVDFEGLQSIHWRHQAGYLDKKEAGLEAAKVMAQAPFNNFAQAMNPFIKGGVTAVTGVELYPDIFDPRIVASGSSRKSAERAVLNVLGTDAKKFYQSAKGDRRIEDTLYAYFAGWWVRPIDPETLAEQVKQSKRYSTLKNKSKTTGRRKGQAKKGKEKQFHEAKIRGKALKKRSKF